MIHFPPMTVLILASMCWWPSPTLDQNRQRREAGEILKITCKGTLRRPTEPDRQLDSRTPKPLKLYALDELKCVGRGIIAIIVYGQKIDVKESDNWYAISDTNAESDKPYPGRVGALKGTFKLDPRGSIPEDVHAYWAKQGIPLVTPPELAIDIDKKTVTIASSMFPSFSLQADGRAYELALSDGRIVKAFAEIDGGRLRIKASTPGVTNFEAVFNLQPNGNLEVVRTIEASDKPPVVSKATYFRVSDEAFFNLYGAAANTARAVDSFVLRRGDRIVAEVDNDISSTKAKEGDPFTLTVMEPAEYKGAKLRGYVSGVSRGRQGVELRLSFRVIVLPSGKLYSLPGTLIVGTGKNDKLMETTKNQTTQVEGAIMGITTGSTQGGGIITLPGGQARTIPLSTGDHELKLEKGTLITISAEQP